MSYLLSQICLSSDMPNINTHIDTQIHTRLYILMCIPTQTAKYVSIYTNTHTCKCNTHAYTCKYIYI